MSKTELIRQSDALAKQLYDMDQFKLAAMQSEITIAMQPTNYASYFNSGKCYYYAGEYHMALNRMQKALDLNSKFEDAKQEIVLYETWLGNFEKARNLASELTQTPHTIFNEGWHLLRDGKFLDGMGRLEQGRQARLWGNAELMLSTKKYKGGDVSGKVVLLITEAGLGDEIIFSRFATEFKNRGAKQVLLACNKGLMSLFAQIDGVDAVYDHDKDFPEHDLWLPAMSSPVALGVDAPGSKPYLTPSPEYVAKWKERLNFSGTPKIAIRWRGNQEFEQDQKRTLDPVVMQDKLKEYGVLYSVQKDMPAPEGVIDLGPELETWEDTAAVLSLMDCVVSSCTSVPHMAGALGVPTVVVTPIVSYFTWAKPTVQSEWYNSVKIARQTDPYNWDDAYRQMVDLTKQTLEQRKQKVA